MSYLENIYNPIKGFPLISVIVPVYNVEDYLEECIASIVSQDYKNLEIILINDGSTDNSGLICDKLKNTDCRIKVYHKKNGGLSDARNLGLSLAKGDFIGFVDSDDTIEYNMYSVLLNLCISYNTDIACSRFDTFGNGALWQLPADTGNSEIMTSYEMMRLIICPWLYKNKFSSISVWDRLYKRDVLNNLLFEKGKTYEDIVFSTKVLLRVKQCAYINKSLYHYRLRQDSITGNDMMYNERWLTDKYPAEVIQIKLLEQYEYKDLALMKKMVSYLDLCTLYRLCNNDDSKKKIAKCLLFIKPSIKEVLKHTSMLNGIKVLNKLMVGSLKKYL